jgi:arylsulfatase
VLVGLFSPAMIGTVAVGAAAGAVAGRFAGHKLTTGIQEKVAENLKPGTAVVLGVFPAEQRLTVERSLPGSSVKSVVESDERGLDELKRALGEALGKFVPDRTVLPIPDKGFGGVAGRSFDESVGDWSIIAGPRAPEGAPNVLVVLIDDAGFGAPDTFGGGIRTPNLTRVQGRGITYNRFHVTAVCSPTRAALLTGRNHHRVGMGGVAEFPGPFPGYTGVRPKSCAALPRILRENGYVTAGFGKWHLTPGRELGAAGPFEHWPTGWGFDHYWGFLTGAAGQYDPIITQDNSTLGVPGGKDGKLYYFPDDITDKTIEWLHAVRAQDQDKPWFVYYSTGATHAPHHVAKEWADRYKGQFDEGWDVYRERTLERQKRLGVVPADTELTPRPEAYPAWDSLSEAEKRLYVRQMEVFAGFSENADWNVGRLLDEVERMGEMDNTLVFYIWGDNGASMEGTVTGSFNEMTVFNGVVLSAEEQLALIDKYGGIAELGGLHTAPHFAAAWAHANNAPFQWGKQMASHLGGTRAPMVVSWPNRIGAGGALREQFTHCNDLASTVLDAAGLPVPTRVDGIAQEPMDGVSFAHTFDDPAGQERHTVQYFEMAGSRAIYSDGWWACAKLDKMPWDFSAATMARFAPGSGWSPHADEWELYYLPDDFSQARNLAAEHPEKVAELVDLFWAEAERNRVLPILGGFSAFFGVLPPLPTQTRFTFYEDVANIQSPMIPRILGRSYAIEADVHVPDAGAEGVLVAFADFIGGFALWVDSDGYLHHTYQYLGIDTYKQSSTTPIPTGDVKLTMLFQADQPRPGTGGDVTLLADGQVIGSGRIPHTVGMVFTSYAGMDIGRDNGGVVDLAYEDRAPYPFTGTIDTITFDLTPQALDDEQAIHQAAAQGSVAHGAGG